MKTLYLIILILLTTSCSAASIPQESAAESQPTVPPAWLTRPPTPVIAGNDEHHVRETDTSTSSSAASASSLEATATALPEPEPSPTTAFHLPRLFGRQWTLSADSGVPEAYIARARKLANDRPDDFLWVEPGSVPTDITLKIGGREPLGDWLYIVTAAFPTLKDEISVAELRAVWAGEQGAGGPLLVGENTLPALRALWGAPGEGVTAVDENNLAGAVWEQRPALAIMPFEALSPELKLLALDDQSPLQPEFDQNTYALRLPVGLEGEREALAAFLGAWDGPPANFNPDHLTRLAMTGVTALVRATAAQMEIDGILAPARDVGPVLRDVDIAHISNEISFVADCPEPSPVGGTSFCSQDAYFALLEEIGTDVVELTGNHLNDYGSEHVPRTIDMYEAAGMSYFGGGRDAADAQRAAIFEHNGNRIALVGCNFFGPVYAWATESSPGSRECGPDFFEQISQLKEEGYVVVATQQYTEYYQYEPTAEQQADFEAIAAAGAAAVSGSQGHHAQGFEFYDGSFIHFGLGNLFFDQMDMLGTRQSFVDIYSIYEGRLINVDLWTGLIEDFFMPRTMTAAEREEALQAVFQASGW